MDTKVIENKANTVLGFLAKPVSQFSEIDLDAVRELITEIRDEVAPERYWLVINYDKPQHKRYLVKMLDLRNLEDEEPSLYSTDMLGMCRETEAAAFTEQQITFTQEEIDTFVNTIDWLNWENVMRVSYLGPKEEAR